MEVNWLELQNFRSFAEVELKPATGGLSVVVGENGAGKTSLLEAIAYTSLAKSFREAPREAIVRDGHDSAVVRLEATTDTRTTLTELSISRAGRDHIQLNRKRIARAEVLLEALRVTVFTPDDLVLVKGGPSERREFLDAVLAGVGPRLAQLRRTVDRVLRHRSTLLRQAGGRLTPDIASTLDVWDSQLADAGGELADRREETAAALEPVAADAFSHLTREPGRLRLHYERSWSGDLATALAAARNEDLRRAATTVGPHRDELAVSLGSLDART
ncbi:MAG TPA: DNA replication and repair protein RecF, partial [Acidimicrobiales bacterium]|nr:DNA replication and repair protein RecF [Acidimicrobiales bacterium]